MFIKKHKINIIHYSIAIVGSILSIGIGTLIGKEIGAQNLAITTALPNTLQATAFSVKFNEGGSNNPGLFIIDSIELLANDIDVVFSNQTLTCSRRIHGYYFSSARGMRLRPLSSKSKGILEGIDSSYNNLDTTGGLYTSCNGNPEDIVGYLSYQENGNNLGYLLLGVETNTVDNSYNSSFSSENIILKDFTNPLGNFYDTFIGIGKIEGNGNNIDVEGLLWNISVQGRLGISKTIDSNERITLKSSSGKKSLLYTNNETTTASVINKAQKNKKKYCRGGEKISNLDNIGTSDIVCFDETVQANSIRITADIADDLEGKDLFVTEKDVIIDKGAFGKKLSIFIDKGNLLIDSNISESNLSDFDKNGYVKTSTDITKGIFLDGNYIVNGLVMGVDASGSYLPIEAKTFIHGKLVSLNLPTTLYGKREEQISRLFSSQKYNNIKGYISLQDVFTWKCDNISGMGQTGSINTTIPTEIACDDLTDNHRRSALIVLEKDYPTIILSQ